MGCCFGRDNDKTTYDGDESERNKLLGASTTRPSSMPVYSGISDHHHNSLKKGDEQSALDRILHNTANNIIDVSALDSRRMEQHEYLDRARHYSTRVNANVGSTTHIHSTLLHLPMGTSMPYGVLSEEPVSMADINLITHASEVIWQACQDIKVTHKEDLVVRFEIPAN